MHFWFYPLALICFSQFIIIFWLPTLFLGLSRCLWSLTHAPFAHTLAETYMHIRTNTLSTFSRCHGWTCVGVTQLFKVASSCHTHTHKHTRTHTRTNCLLEIHTIFSHYQQKPRHHSQITRFPSTTLAMTKPCLSTEASNDTRGWCWCGVVISSSVLYLNSVTPNALGCHSTSQQLT